MMNRIGEGLTRSIRNSRKRRRISFVRCKLITNRKLIELGHYWRFASLVTFSFLSFFFYEMMSFNSVKFSLFSFVFFLEGRGGSLSLSLFFFPFTRLTLIECLRKNEDIKGNRCWYFTRAMLNAH